MVTHLERGISTIICRSIAYIMTYLRFQILIPKTI